MSTMFKRLKKITGILLLLIIFIIGSVVAAYPIESRRIKTFCSSIAVGSDKQQVLNQAGEMFGVEIRGQPNGDSFFVKSMFTYKTLCMVKAKDSRVTEAYYFDD